MKALVTGATGFIGSTLCRELKKKAFEVRALTLPGEDTRHIENCVSQIRTGDITFPESLKGIGDGMDVVFHLAARVLDYGSKKQFYDPIFHGTKNMLAECAGKAARFLNVSSFAACGLGRHLKGYKEEDEPRKSGIPYNDAKLDAEQLVKSYHHKFSHGCTNVRPVNVIGPRSVWVVEVLRQFQKAIVPLVDRGRYGANLIYIDSLVDGIIMAATMDIASGQTYHFQDDWQVTWKQYLTDLAAMVNKKPIGNLPYSVGWTLAKMSETVFTPLGLRPPITRLAVAMMGRDNRVDNTKAKRELGWHTPVSYTDAMKKIHTWVMKNFPT